MFKKPEFIFIIFALIFGFFMLFITPKFGVSDEPAHFIRAKEVSQGILYNNLPENRTDNYQYHGASGYSPVMYSFAGVTLKLTQKFNEDFQFYAGRIANLIVWILLIASCQGIWINGGFTSTPAALKVSTIKPSTHLITSCCSTKDISRSI